MGLLQADACIADILQTAVDHLEKAGVEEALIDAELLLEYCTGKSRTELYLAAAAKLDITQQIKFDEMIHRRCRREPVAYIIGEREFWSQRFIVTPDVLIPRPETEFLVESSLEARKNAGETRLCLDLCCGSGVIGIILALEMGCRVVGVDISDKALGICKKNCELHGVADKVMVVQSDLATCISRNVCFDLITANPPYIRHREIETELDPDVADYEPLLALDGGEDGLDLIRRIARFIPWLLKSSGDFFMEIGYDQGHQVKQIFSEGYSHELYKSVEILKDYAERDRVVHVSKID